MPEDPKQPSVELHRDKLLTPEAVVTLGGLCAQALSKVGVVTLLVRPDGFVAYATPFYVHVERDAVPDPELLNRPYRFVRPILSDGKAKFVAWKDRELWEIAFEEDEDAVKETTQP